MGASAAKRKEPEDKMIEVERRDTEEAIEAKKRMSPYRVGKLAKAASDAFSMMVCNKHIGNASYEDLNIMLLMIQELVDRGKRDFEGE